ncbi:unnamed protein product [Rhodiola kirilowii]
MHEDESIKDFNPRVCDIVNEASTLGEALPEEKVVRKILRSLPKRFTMKVTTIEEANNVKTMGWKELIGNLCTYELQHLTVPEPKVKSVGLKAKTVVDDESTDGVSEELALLIKNFNKLLKKINPNGPKEYSTGNADDLAIQAECANTLKKKKKKKNSKSLNVSWSDDETEESTKEEETSKFIALTSMIDCATDYVRIGSKDVPTKKKPRWKRTKLKKVMKKKSMMSALLRNMHYCSQSGLSW